MKYSNEYAELVEFDEFIKFANKHLTDEEYSDLTLFLASHPEEGVIIAGTGGVRKLRWAAKGKGKSGGVRIIYYYHNIDIPLFLLTGFAKSEMENIGKAARNAYKKLIPLLVEQYSKD